MGARAIALADRTARCGSNALESAIIMDVLVCVCVYSLCHDGHRVRIARRGRAYSHCVCVCVYMSVQYIMLLCATGF